MNYHSLKRAAPVELLLAPWNVSSFPRLCDWLLTYSGTDHIHQPHGLVA
ncbi:MAG: hypothetical protein ACFFD4_05840 [Candidatus Odinarchaeota archaeon]